MGSMADVIAEADKLGPLCLAAHIDRTGTGFEMLAEGYPNWKQDILLSTGLYGIEVDDSSHLPWFSQDDECGDAGGQRRAVALKRKEQLSKNHAGRSNQPSPGSVASAKCRGPHKVADVSGWAGSALYCEPRRVGRD